MSHDESRSTDLRIRRTQKFLQEAIIELIAEKGFDAITVGDIADRAMINRATFYRHYQDKYDLVVKIFEDTANYLVENMLPVELKDSPKEGIAETPEIWVQFFTHVAKNAQLYSAMLGKNGSPWFAAKMREYIIKIMLDAEKQWMKLKLDRLNKSDPAMPPELPATQLSHVLIGTIVWWLESDQRQTPKQMAIWFHYFAFYGYLATLGYTFKSSSSS